MAHLHSSTTRSEGFLSRLRDAVDNLSTFQKLSTIAVAVLALGGIGYGVMHLSPAANSSPALSTLSGVSRFIGGGSAPAFQAVSVLDHSRAHTRGLSGEEYDRIGQILDNPDAIFQKANYQPVWTASPQSPPANLPKNCTVIPHESRTWEPWFRQELKNGDSVLSTGDLLMLRDNIVLAVANDPRTQFHNGTGIPVDSLANYWCARIDAVRKEVLAEFGVDKPSLALRQVTIADATTAFVKSQRNYGLASNVKYLDREHIWPTAGQMLNNNLDIACQQAASLDARLIRTIEAQNLEDGAATGIKAGARIVARRYGNVKVSHVITGVRVSLGYGRYANLYYDGTPRRYFIRSAIDVIAESFGPMDQACMERFTNAHSICQATDDASRMGAKPSNADGNFPDGENWKCFSLGNYVPYFDGKNGQTEHSDFYGALRNNPNHEKPWIILARWQKEHQHLDEGYNPYEKYYDQNSQAILTLNRTIDESF